MWVLDARERPGDRSSRVGRICALGSSVVQLVGEGQGKAPAPGLLTCHLAVAVVRLLIIDNSSGAIKLKRPSGIAAHFTSGMTAYQCFSTLALGLWGGSFSAGCPMQVPGLHLTTIHL